MHHIILRVVGTVLALDCPLRYASEEDVRRKTSKKWIQWAIRILLYVHLEDDTHGDILTSAYFHGCNVEHLIYFLLFCINGWPWYSLQVSSSPC